MNTFRTFSFLLIMAVLGWSFPVLSQNRSAADAEQIANSFLSKPRKAAPRGSVPMLQPSMRLYTTSTEMLDRGGVEPAFYVFTPQDNNAGGFVIVSGIEEAAPILGFSYTDVFDVNQIPPAMRYLLGKYKEEIDAYLSISPQEKQRHRYSSDRRQNLPVIGQGVSPLIQSHWNQNAPFNNLCPMDGYERCVTGCTATSAAQVMKFYEYPSQGTGSISYTTETKQIPVSFNFSTTTFAWSRMLDSYSDGNYTSSQATAVATLMAACGAAFEMDYQSSSSGANVSKQMAGLISYLGYDTDMASLYRDYVTAEQWHTLILDQLNDRHPVIFSGQSGDGGHSFILDGYINDDPDNPSYHVNWGWGGYYDDYFKVSALDPEGQGIGGSSGGYKAQQCILFGCFPENSKVDHGCLFLGENVTVSPSTVAPNTAASVTITLQNFYNFSNKSFTGEFRFYLKRGTSETYLGRMTGAEDVGSLSGYSHIPYSATLPSNLSEGTYEVIVKSKQTGSNIEEPIFWKNGNFKFVVSDTGEDPEAPEYSADLQTTGFEIISYSGRYIEASVAEILNMAELSFSGNVKLALADTQGNLLTTFGEPTSINGLGQYYNLVNPRTLSGSIPEEFCVDGRYRLYAAANQTGYSGWSYLRGYSVEGNYLTDYNRECYLDLWISGGVIGVPSYNVSISCSEGGRVESSKTTIESNGQVTFTIIPDEDYDLYKAQLNGEDVTNQIVNYQYTVNNVNEDLFFNVTFGKAPEYLANLQMTGFNVLSSSGRTLSVELAQIANFGDEPFTGVISLALADRYNNLVSVFGERTEISELGYYRYLTYPRTLTSTIPQEINDGYYRLCAVAKQQGKSGWSMLKRFELENNYIISESMDCYEHIWLSNSVLSTPTFLVTTQVTGGGSVTPSSQTVVGGGSVAFTFKADEGYSLTAAKLNQLDILSSVVNNQYQVDEVIENLTLSATFASRNYTLTYMLDGAVYKTIEYAFGAVITPEANPEKEGYTFSGWSEIPTTMPARDVVVYGSFIVNNYTLTYKVDGIVYKAIEYAFGSVITPEAAPEKEGYSFSGWSDIPATMPAHDVVVTGSFTVNNYTLSYWLDGSLYKSVVIAYGAAITPEANPEKEGYTFSGWSEIPTTMPAHDVDINGSFIANNYTLTYKVDGTVYKAIEYAFGSVITPEAAPEKEGYSFSGWSDIPATMPAHDVVVTGSFTVNNYTLSYWLDGSLYKSVVIAYGAAITPERSPEKEGYTFSGWQGIPAVMPAYDVDIYGFFKINSYLLTWVIDGEPYLTEILEYGQTIVAPVPESREGYDFAWNLENVPVSMPARDLVIYGYYTVGLDEIICDNKKRHVVFDLQGRQVRELIPGNVYIRDKKKFFYNGE